MISNGTCKLRTNFAVALKHMRCLIPGRRESNKIDVELNKRYSVEGLLNELEKIKIMILPDGEKITTEITKKQREILDALHMRA